MFDLEPSDASLDLFEPLGRGALPAFEVHDRLTVVSDLLVDRLDGFLRGELVLAHESR